MSRKITRKTIESNAGKASDSAGHVKKKRGGRRSLKLDIRITNDVDELRESVLSRELTEFCQEQKMRELGFEPYERASELYEDLPAHEDDEKWSNFDGIVS